MFLSNFRKNKSDILVIKLQISGKDTSTLYTLFKTLYEKVTLQFYTYIILMTLTDVTRTGRILQSLQTTLKALRSHLNQATTAFKQNNEESRQKLK